MNNILIFPDIHGRTFWKSVNPKDYDLAIFIGDYVDPYPQENITPEDALDNLKDLVEFKKSNSNSIFLIGNHDMPYINSEYASYFSYKDRFSYKYSEEIGKLINMLNPQLVYKIDKYLFSHAGFNNKFDNHIKHKVEGDISIRDLARVSFYRGGRDSFGSNLWSDIKEHFNSDPNKYLSKVVQIFGHTQMKMAVHHANWYCLDCRQPFELNIETNEIKNIITSEVPIEI